MHAKNVTITDIGCLQLAAAQRSLSVHITYNCTRLYKKIHISELCVAFGWGMELCS